MADNRGAKITCKDCNQEFIFTIGEQDFYESKGLTQPKRCLSCRDIRRAEREQQEDTIR